jgi:hypothetical protein
MTSTANAQRLRRNIGNGGGGCNQQPQLQSSSALDEILAVPATAATSAPAATTPVTTSTTMHATPVEQTKIVANIPLQMPMQVVMKPSVKATNAVPQLELDDAAALSFCRNNMSVINEPAKAIAKKTKLKVKPVTHGAVTMAVSLDPEFRQWTNADETKTVKAALTSVIGDTVYMRTFDHKPKIIDIDTLSKKDREFVRQFADSVNGALAKK